MSGDLPRLLFCSFDVIPSPSGWSRRVTEYVKGLAGRFAVVILSAKTPDHAHIERYHGARLLRVPVGNGSLPSQVQAFERAVSRQLESEEYVIAHFTDPFSGKVLSARKKVLGYQLVHEIHHFSSVDLPLLWPVLTSDEAFLQGVREREAICLASADAVITGNRVMQERVVALGVPRERTRVLPPPVDMDQFRLGDLGAPDGTPMRALYLGRGAPWQELGLLLEGVNQARTRAPLTLTILGPLTPERSASLSLQISKLKLKDVVSVQPAVPHAKLPGVLGRADLVILPLDSSARHEQLGSSLASVSEASAAARPLLAADLAVTRNATPPDGTVFYRPGNADSLAEALVMLAGSPERRVTLGRHARVWAEEKVDSPTVQAQLLDLYEKLTENAAPIRRSDQSESAFGTPTFRVPVDPAVLFPDSGPKRAPKQAEAAAPAEELADVAPAPDLSTTDAFHIVEAAPVEAPPVEAPPVEAPPVEAPPVEAPPVEAPPVEAPPVEAPPVEAPPVEAPPVEAPPVEAPPVEAPPVEAPPVEAPPVEAPPVEAPPVEAPPVEAPPVEVPPVEPPPIKAPPVEVPPIEAPPVEGPPRPFASQVRSSAPGLKAFTAAHVLEALRDPVEEQEAARNPLPAASAPEPLALPEASPLPVELAHVPEVHQAAAQSVVVPEPSAEAPSEQALATDDQVEDEFQEVDGADFLEDDGPDSNPAGAAPPPLPAKPAGVPVRRRPAQVASADESINLFWRAQLLHGYCPPEEVPFNRLPPPTTFPGRDDPAPAPMVRPPLNPASGE